MDVELLNSYLVEETKKEYSSDEVERLYAKWLKELMPLLSPGPSRSWMRAGSFSIPLCIKWKYQSSEFSESFRAEFRAKPSRTEVATDEQLEKETYPSERVALKALAKALDKQVVVRHHNNTLIDKFTTLDILLEESVSGDVIIRSDT